MELISSILRSIFNALLFPPLIFVLLMLLYVFYKKNKKITFKQKMISGDSVESAVVLTLSQFIFGIFGGIIASIILSIFGVVFNENCRIEILFLTSLILTFIKPRFICFSYSAALLGFIGIILKMIGMMIPEFNYTDIFKLDILYMMIFVGVMHIIEGILVFFDGHRGAVPIFVEKDEKILKGYSMNRYWAVPIAMIIMGNMINSNELYSSIPLYNIPSCWNIIKSQDKIDYIKTAFLYIFSFYAVVGYSSVTYTRTKKEKAHSSGIHIFSYGVLLVLIAQISRIGIAGEILVIIFAPTAHEFMINIQRKKEEIRNYKSVRDNDSMTISKVFNDSETEKFNTDISSRIIFVNDEHDKSKKHNEELASKKFKDILDNVSKKNKN